MNQTAPRQDPPEITWTVPLERANMILSILAKQPFEVISPVMDDLRQQAQAQFQKIQQMQMMSGNGEDRDGIRPS